ncbi:hypothetical protein C3747_190g22 [Trypanosoma cruzi]|uniref:Phosphatidylinositol N-acetylglucosaminyltransferase subunit H conserved domain-containing protein n=2 Tax=Trypanosoma cruzi TaxID=5693 RepID=Q4CX60_TRYCC|nr:hypothetical protein, conserved [Trypanosoma cruzi]EAN84857.1 hypothetical protein, conserved [Trypanosoma cruzi]PWV02159.1 hypothetical protein C3747_190g22 [Trypanosoma cruzi]RNC43525.1 phosphatidylinositol glycan, class H [Trypanosoma cruzi]|eukprot:XP_806708.1 hypothetical protein [Trypanosoma cruzi strain CL Brener]
MSETKTDSVSSRHVSPKVLLEGHITSTNVMVDVFQTDYNDCFRSYRVCQRNPFGPNTSFLLRIFSVNDVMLLLVLIALALPSLPTFLGPLQGANWMYFSLNGTEKKIDGVVPLLMDKWTPNSFLPRLFLMIFCCILSVWRMVAGFQRAHIEEVMVIRGLGMQITNYNVFGWICSQRFIELKLIRSLVIHDAFFRYQAIFFLSATIENDATRLVLFEETLPRLAVLCPVLCGLRHILYEEPENGATLAELEGVESERLDDTMEGEYKATDDDSDITDRENGDSFAFTNALEREGNYYDPPLMEFLHTK